MSSDKNSSRETLRDWFFGCSQFNDWICYREIGGKMFGLKHFLETNLATENLRNIGS